MSFRKTISWFLFPLTMWYAIGVWLRNLLYDVGIRKQHSMPVTTIGVGNLCVGGAGKTPHVEYLLRLLADQQPTALLSRGYHRKTRGYLRDDGSHDARRLGDEPAMVAYKFPQVTVAVCERRVEGVRRLLKEKNPPQLVVLDDVFQHRHIKPTVTILLTEYGKPYFKDHIMPYGDLRESRRGRYRADIVVVTKSPEKIDPIERHNIVNDLKLRPYQKIFFSYVHYCDPRSIVGGAAMPLSGFDHALVVTGIAHPEPMLKHVRQACKVTAMRFEDHHTFVNSDIKKIVKQFEQLEGVRKVILTTEKDAVRLPISLLAGLPVYVLPIEVRIHSHKDYDFDQIITNAVNGNKQFLRYLHSPCR